MRQYRCIASVLLLRACVKAILELSVDKPSITNVTKTCQQPGCSFPQDGTCLEGLADPLQCPHLVSLSTVGGHESGSSPEQQADEIDAAGGEIEEDVSTDNWLPLPDGYELDIAEARRITGGQEARVVVLAGEPAAGKTTFIACLYEKFCEGPFSSLQFKGSNTLLAFERACHLSRTSSEAEEADTQPTKGLDPRFFHLVVRDEGANENDHHILLTDVSGEAYQRATNYTEDAKKLSFIRRADAFLLLLDGKRLASKLERQEVFGRGLLLLRSLTEASMLDHTSSVRVAISKFDLLQPQVVDENTIEFLGYVKSELVTYAGQRYKNFEVIEIASRPRKGSGLPYAHGLDLLIRGWLKSDPIKTSVPTYPLSEMPSQGREADLFLWRHFAR